MSIRYRGLRHHGLRLISPRFAVALALAVLFAACGGGGGGAADDAVGVADGSDGGPGADAGSDVVAPDGLAGDVADAGAPADAATFDAGDGTTPDVFDAADVADAADEKDAWPPTDTAPDASDVSPPDAADAPDAGPPPDVARPDVPVTPATLVIAELLIDPCQADDEDGEWVEVINVGGAVVDLNGWTVTDDDGADEHVIHHPVPLRVGPGQRVVLGATTETNLNGAVDVDYAWGADVRLANTADELVLKDPTGAVADRVSWGGAAGPAAPQCAALALDPAWLDPDENDDPDVWCPAEATFGWGDFGTPGRPNAPCPAVDPCGNGRLDDGEACDDGAANSDTEPDACRTDCTEARCGDGVEDSDESCDDGARNSDLAPNACRTDCTDWRCGDGVPDGGEDCDDGNGEGGDGCEPDCTFSWLCGNGVREPGEACDDGEGNSDDRPDACRTNCSLAMCGDGVQDSAEACDGGADNSDEAPDACRTDCQAAHCGDRVIDSGETCDDGGTQPGDGCDAICQEEAPGPGRPTVHGQVVITEIMKNPVVVADADGEWVELYNPSALTFALDGCLLRDGAADEHAIAAAGGLLLEPQAYLVLGRNADPAQNGGATVDYVYDAFFLNNDADSIRLVCGGVVIDRVDFADPDFPDVPGRSMSLDPAYRNASANDDGGHWCDASVDDALRDGNFGTPGAPNPACPEAAVCGDGVEQTGEACDEGDANSDEAPNACRTDCALPSCGDGVPDDAYGEACDDGGRESGDGCSADCLAEVGATPAAAGDLVVAEIMKEPVAVAEAAGEWLEIANPGPAALDLDGCVIGDLSGDAHLIDAGGALIVQPGDRVVLAANGDPLASDGVPADYVYDRAELALDDFDEVILTCGEIVIDAVLYDPFFYPHEPGRSLSLDPGLEDATSNDAATAWCPGEGIYGSYNRGTPGAPNDPCPASGVCGNGDPEPGEQCDTGILNSDVRPDRCRTDCTLPRCGDRVVDGGEACDDGNDSDGDGCSGLCVDEGAQRPTAAGALLWTELLLDPTPRPPTAQWLELRNASGVRLDLSGCVVRDGPSGGFTLGDGFEAAPGAVLLLAAAGDPAGDGSVAADVVYDRLDLPLASAAGALELACDGLVIDRVAWDVAAGWPVEAGRAMALDGLVRGHDANDVADNWCVATTPFGAGAGFGTPGALNDRCPGTCGNGVAEWDEACDQGILNSDTRADRCRTDCTSPRCGDGVRDTGEGCDDGNADAGDGCAPGCTTEVATECGNGVTEVGEECDDGERNSDAAADACRTDCRRPSCGDDVVDSGEDCDDGNSLPGDGCSPLCFWDYEPQRPDEPGQAVVTEIMPSPSVGAEWFELLNVHPWPLELEGCVVTDGGDQRFVFGGSLIVEPGGLLVVAAGPDPAGDDSVAPGYVYDAASYSLAAVDTLRLVCGAVLVDRVRWTSPAFPQAPGASAALDPQAWTATANDAAGNWCLATTPLGAAGDFGTPGALNVDCGLLAICGNGIPEAGEDCDDGAFNSATRPDACRGDCRDAFCGDGVVDAGEDCDDENDLDGDGCSAACVTEPHCGDGEIGTGEVCDDGPDNSDTVPDACRTDCRAARCGDGVEDGGEDCDDGGVLPDDGCSPLCEYDSTPEPVTAPGQVLFTEVFADPAGINDNVGEWFELTSGDLGVYDLDGCVVHASGGDEITVDGPLRVGPGQHRVFAPSDDPAEDGSVFVDAVYAFLDLSLANSGDTLTIVCGDVTVDTVTWTTADWPVGIGRSLALDPTARSAVANDLPGAWCAGSVPYGAAGANFGTPGFPNPSCAYAAICGNGLLELGEACDDGDANSDVLPDACRIDCREASCGDGVQDSVEDCDDGGTEAGDGCGPTCEQEGTCGNGELEPGEECDDGPLNSDSLPDRCRTNCRDARCGDRVVDTGEACDDGDDQAGDGCTPECAWEVLAAPSLAGDVIFAEILADPVGTADDVGEWFELLNPSDRIFDLEGCRVESAGEAGFAVFGPLVVYDGEAVVFGASGDPAGNGDVLVDYVFTRLEAALDGTADALQLVCGDVVIDAIAWDAAVDWPVLAGRSLSLDPGASDADANDLSTAWCPGADPYGATSADHGTPGRPNPACP